jgi:hypothetical protein
LQPVNQPGEFFLFIFWEIAEKFDESARPNRLIILEGLFPVGGYTDIDFALVARVYLTSYERAFTSLQRANDSRHLCRQDAKDTLDVPNDHRSVLLEDRQSKEFQLLQVSDTPAAAKRR